MDEERTRASIWTLVIGISASMSMTLDMLAGMASYVGRSTTGAAAVGAGSEAAIAAAIEVAIEVGPFCGWIKVWSLKFGPATFRGATVRHLDEQLARRCVTCSPLNILRNF